MTIRSRCLVIGTAIMAVVPPAAANEVADFYKGKTLTIVVGHEVGTGFDVYARALQRHFGRHLPGNPNVVVQNMPGASGTNAANWLYNIAPKDGSVISTFVYAVPFEPLMGSKAAKYEAAKFTWIGNITESIQVCGVSKAAGIGRFDDLRTTEVIIGGTATSGPLTKSAFAVRNLLGAKMKIVAGYKGSADLKLAIGRGEVQGVCGLQLSTIKSAWREDYESGNFRPIIQLSGRKQAVLAIPHVDDYPGSNDDRQIRGLIFGMQALGGLYASAPGIPTARKAALRAALLATVNDPQFVADAAKTQIDISPMTGAEVEAFITRVSTTVSPEIVERAKQAFAP